MSTSIKIKSIIISILIVCFLTSLSYAFSGNGKIRNVKVILFDRTPGVLDFTPSLVMANKVTIDNKSVRYSDLLGINHKCSLKYLVFFSSDISKFLDVIREKSIFQGATSTEIEFIPKVKDKEAQCYDLHVGKKVYQIKNLENGSTVINFNLREEGDYSISIRGNTDVAFSVYRMEIDGKLQKDPFTGDEVFFINGGYFPKFIQFFTAFIPAVTTDCLHLKKGTHNIRLVPVANTSRLFINNIKVAKK